jgi:hypothetical protein
MKVVKLYSWATHDCPEIPLRHILASDERHTWCKHLVAFTDPTGTHIPDELVNEVPTCLRCLAGQADDD